MRKYYNMKVAGLDRALPLCPLNDEIAIAGFVIFGDPELTVATARELLARAPEYDYIITAEAVASAPKILVVGSPGMIWKAKNAKKETMTMVRIIISTFFTMFFMVIISF